jgi:hypothetical protein
MRRSMHLIPSGHGMNHECWPADRKHRQHCAKEGQKVQPKKDCCTGLIEDADGRCTTGPPSNPCQGQADGTCCAGDTGKQWCQGGRAWPCRPTAPSPSAAAPANSAEKIGW